MDKSNFLNARKWIKIVAGPIAMFIIMTLWYTVFKNEENLIYSLLIIGGISLVFFYLSYYVISPKSVYSGSLRQMVVSTVLFSTFYVLIHLFIFGTQIIQLPFPFTIEDYPISFYISLLYIIALTLFLAGLSLHLVINQLSISHESMSLLKSSYKNEIETLKLQMNPHFIANALNNLNSLMLNNDRTSSISYASELIELVGKQINSSAALSIPIKQEIQWIETYLKMEQGRMQYAFEFKISIDPQINPNTDIPSMLLQPIIENSIIHGFDPDLYSKKGMIEISIQKKRYKGLIIEIKDNGLGINAKKKLTQKNRKSVSTENIANRIRLINEMGDFYIRKNTKIDGNGAVVTIHINTPII